MLTSGWVCLLQASRLTHASPPCTQIKTGHPFQTSLDSLFPSLTGKADYTKAEVHTLCLDFASPVPEVCEAVDVKSTDPIKEEEKCSNELTPVCQRETCEGEVILHEDGEAQNTSGRQQKRDEDENGTHCPFPPCIGIIADLGHHQQLQAKYGNHNSKRHHAPDGNHPHAQPLHLGQAEVGDTLQDAVVAKGAEVPQSKELPPRKEPAAIADGDGRQDHGYRHAQDDQAPDERLKEGFLWSPVRQQLLRLKGECEGKKKQS